MTEIISGYSASQITLAGLAIGAAIGMAWIDARRQRALKKCRRLGDETQRLAQSRAGMRDLLADLLGTVNLTLARGEREPGTELAGEVQRLRCEVEKVLVERDGNDGSARSGRLR